MTPLPLVNAGTLTVGVDASPPPPMHMGDPDTPGFTGFEVDLVQAIAAELSVGVRYEVALWRDMLPALLAGRMDLVCTAATISPERRHAFAFGTPYLDIRLAIVAKAGGPIGASGDLRGRRIGVRVATTAAEWVERHSGAREIDLFDLNTDVYAALATGRIDAAVDDSPIAGWFAQQNSALKMVDVIASTDAQYAMMFGPGNGVLRDAVDAALARIKADDRFARIRARWFADRDAVGTRRTGIES